MTRLLHWCALVSLALVLAACGSTETESGRGAPDTVAKGAPSHADLEAATVVRIADLPDSVTLAAGRWEGEPFVEGGASRPTLVLVPGLHLTGDLDGDGDDEAVALLGASYGGTGDLVHVAVFAREGAGVRNLANALLGDRVQVRTARLDGRRIVMNVVQAAPNDALCCPAETAERVFAFEAGALREVPAATTRGRLTVAELEGVTWVLRAWDRDEPAADAPEISFKVDAGLASGTAGCNQFLANLTARGLRPGELAVKIEPATYTKCGEPADSLEARFLRQMSGAQSYSFVATRLALTYPRGDGSGTMYFEARKP